METIVYGHVQGAALLADIAAPDKPYPLPVIISIHGGRWYYGTRRDTGSINVEQWAEFGFFGVVVYTRVQTPRFCGHDLSAGESVFLRDLLRPLRTN